MRLKTTFAATLSLAATFYASDSKGNTEHYLFNNEQTIEFKANSGETTDAVEGHFWVAENRNNPNSRKIRVNYVRFPATGKKTGSPIVYLSGGPGGSGIGTAKWKRFPLFQALREFGDVIALDQRGTGQSQQPESCVSSQSIPLDKIVTETFVKQNYQHAAKECFSFWQSQGVDIHGYTTVQNALDLNDLRKHLKAEKVSLWGISYGSHLAFAAMKLMPQHIDKVIIASAEGLDQTVKLPNQTDLYFENVQSIIDQQALKQQIPDLIGLMKRVHKKLDKSPILLNVANKGGSNTNFLFQTYQLQSLASMMIADPNQYLAMLIHLYLGLDNGNTALLTNILQRGIFKDEPITFKLMPLAMDVASGITPKRLEKMELQANTSLLGDKLNFPMPMLNMIDPALDLGNDFRSQLNSNIPTLLFTGTLDGRTYPDEQTESISGLKNATQILVKHAGHNLYTASPEVLSRMKSFLGNEVVSAQTIELPVPQLDLPSGR